MNKYSLNKVFVGSKYSCCYLKCKHYVKYFCSVFSASQSLSFLIVVFRQCSPSTQFSVIKKKSSLSDPLQQVLKLREIRCVLP